MAFRINAAVANQGLDGMITSGISILDVYTGAQPATAATAASGTLLASITGITWAAAASNAKSASNSPSAVAGNTGTAGWGRFRNSADTLRFDGVVGAEFTLSNTSVVSGGQVTLSSATITQPLS